jgi:hypothetical protein
MSKLVESDKKDLGTLPVKACLILKMSEFYFAIALEIPLKGRLFRSAIGMNKKLAACIP